MFARVVSNNADQFFLPFKLACDKASPPELHCVAIDSINQLMAYGFCILPLFLYYSSLF